jgi:hypothetical protein
MKRSLVWLAGLLLLASLTGCASNEILRATGTGSLDAYKGRGLTEGQIVPLAKRAAMIDAQRNLLEAYAGTFLDSQTEIKNFVAENDRIISRSRGLIKGVHLQSEILTPNQTAVIVTVQAYSDDIKAALKKQW